MAGSGGYRQPRLPSDRWTFIEPDKGRDFDADSDKKSLDFYEFRTEAALCVNSRLNASPRVSIVCDLGLTLFGSGCYSRSVPFGRGFLLNVRQLGLSKLTRQGEPTTTNDSLQQSATRPRIPPHRVRGLPERLNLVRRNHVQRNQRPPFRLHHRRRFRS